jgi:hypothetical protein
VNLAEKAGKCRSKDESLVIEAVKMPLIFRLQPNIWLIDP